MMKHKRTLAFLAAALLTAIIVVGCVYSARSQWSLMRESTSSQPIQIQEN